MFLALYLHKIKKKKRTKNICFKKHISFTGAKNKLNVVLIRYLIFIPLIDRPKETSEMLKCPYMHIIMKRTKRKEVQSFIYCWCIFYALIEKTSAVIEKPFTKTSSCCALPL